MPGAFYGLASSDVDRVELRTDDGRTIAGTLYPVDTPRTDATQIFLILVPDGANVSGTVVATDATGAEIASEQVTNAR